MEFKQNKFLPAEKQVVTANPDINTVSLSLGCSSTNCLSDTQIYHIFHFLYGRSHNKMHFVAYYHVIHLL